MVRITRPACHWIPLSGVRRPSPGGGPQLSLAGGGVGVVDSICPWSCLCLWTLGSVSPHCSLGPGTLSPENSDDHEYSGIHTQALEEVHTSALPSRNPASSPGLLLHLLCCLPARTPPTPHFPQLLPWAQAPSSCLACFPHSSPACFFPSSSPTGASKGPMFPPQGILASPLTPEHIFGL
jgi:hypothetical protein